jgi:hypothetical protein
MLLGKRPIENDSEDEGEGEFKEAELKLMYLNEKIRGE